MENYIQYLEFNDEEKSSIKSVINLYENFLKNMNLEFKKDFLKYKVQIVSNIADLDSKTISKLMTDIIRDLNFLQEQYSTCDIILNYLKNKFSTLKDKMKKDLQEELLKEKNKVTNSELERELDLNTLIIAFKYVIMVFQGYISILEKKIDSLKMYREVLSREITIRELDQKNKILK